MFRFAVFIFVVFGFGSVQAATYELSATSDGSIHFAGASGITVDTDGLRIETSRSGGNNIRHGLFAFDISAIPSDTNILSAALTVTTSALISNTSPDALVDFYGYASDDLISEEDFDTPTSTDANRVASMTFPAAGISPPRDTSYTLAMENLQPLWNAIDNDEADFFKIRSETINFVTFSVHSLEGNASSVATLSVTTLPEPAAAHLLLPWIGLAIAGLRRRGMNPRCAISV